ncbi:TPA: hypothetical protein ACQ71B_004330, partial [Escherichia coli]
RRADGEKKNSTQRRQCYNDWLVHARRVHRMLTILSEITEKNKNNKISEYYPIKYFQVSIKKMSMNIIVVITELGKNHPAR